MELSANGVHRDGFRKYTSIKVYARPLQNENFLVGQCSVLVHGRQYDDL
jgi:hypothetical protein